MSTSTGAGAPGPAPGPASGPWPDPDDTIDRSGDGAQFDDDRTEPASVHEPAGSKGVALAVAGTNLGFFLLLPAVLVVAIYTFLTVYAIVKAVGSAPDAANPVVVLVGIVSLVGLFVVTLAVGTWLIGRTADPRKRR